MVARIPPALAEKHVLISRRSRTDKNSVEYVLVDRTGDKRSSSGMSIPDHGIRYGRTQGTLPVVAGALLKRSQRLSDLDRRVLQEERPIGRSK